MIGGDTITVVTVTETGEKDKLGVKITEDDSQDQVGCSVQRLSTNETNANVDRTITLRKVFADPTPLMLSLSTGDAIDYLGDRYQIDGDIDKETDLHGRIAFVQFVIRRAAG